MQLKLKPGFIRLNTLALAAALALACTLALLFCGCQSKAEREKLAEEGLSYYKNLDFNNAKRCFLTCGDSYKYTEYLESIAEYEKLYAQAVELVSAGKPNRPAISARISIIRMFRSIHPLSIPPSYPHTSARDMSR